MASVKQESGMARRGMEKKLIQFTDELWEVLDVARGVLGRAAWMEKALWRTVEVKRAASELGIRRKKRKGPGSPTPQRKGGRPRKHKAE